MNNEGAPARRPRLDHHYTLEVSASCGASEASGEFNPTPEVLRQEGGDA